MPTTSMPTVAEVRAAAEGRSEALTGARIAQSMVIAFKTGMTWQTIFETRWPRSVHLDQIKASVPAMGTGSTGALVQEKFLYAWAQSLRPSTVLGRLTGSIPADFYLRLVATLGAATGYWVGEGQAKPLDQGRLLQPRASRSRRKAVALAVLTEEVLLALSVDTEALVSSVNWPAR